MLFFHVSANVACWCKCKITSMKKDTGLKGSDDRGICFSLSSRGELVSVLCQMIFKMFYFHVSAKVACWCDCKITSMKMDTGLKGSDDRGICFSLSSRGELASVLRQRTEGDEYFMLFSPDRLQMFPSRGVALSSFCSFWFNFWISYFLERGNNNFCYISESYIFGFYIIIWRGVAVSFFILDSWICIRVFIVIYMFFWHLNHRTVFMNICPPAGR